MHGDVDGDLLSVVGDLLVEGALQDDLALGAEEALVRGRSRRTLLLVDRRPLDLRIGEIGGYFKCSDKALDLSSAADGLIGS